MVTLADVVNLIYPHLLFYITVILQDVMFSVPVQPDEDVDSGSIWKEKSYQFTCLSQGFTSAPGIYEIAATLMT